LIGPRHAAALRDHGVALHTMLFGFSSGLCSAEVGTAALPTNGQATRLTYRFGWAASEGKGSASMASTCEKALRAAIKNLIGTEAFTDEDLQRAAQWTADPAKPVFVSGNRQPGTVNHFTSGLTDAGTELVVSTLGDRWTIPLDHRKFSAFVMFRQDKTLEGHMHCLVLTGLSPRPPASGTSIRMPALVSSRSLVGQDCARPVIEAGVTELRDSYGDDLEDFYRLSREPGQTYPSIAEVRKALAKFDAEARRKAQSAPTQQSVSTTRNVVRCRNDCVNGNCVRTFEDGRKERWQAPRRYNPHTSNWEWDTTTNACGG